MIDGKKIRELRVSKGYTSYDLSQITKISESYIAEIERGQKQNPSFKVVENLADCLNVPIDELRLIG